MLDNKTTQKQAPVRKSPKLLVGSIAAVVVLSGAAFGVYQWQINNSSIEVKAINWQKIQLHTPLQVIKAGFGRWQ